MSHHIIQALEKKFSSAAGKKMPVLRPGYKVRVHQKIKEGEKERVQIFEGIIIAQNSGRGSSKTFTVRKEVDGIGVEKIFPMYSPNVAKVEIVKTFGVRRAKLFYLRDKTGLSSRLRAKLGMLEKDAKYSKNDEEVVEEAPVAEAPVAEAAPAVAETAPEVATTPATEENKAA